MPSPHELGIALMFLLGSGCTGPVMASAAADEPEPRPPIGVHVEVGLGSTTYRPLADQMTPCEGVWAGVSAPLRRSLSLEAEFVASLGGPSGFVSYSPEAAEPGDRSLTAFLLGVEGHSGFGRHGPFASMGVGVGHSTLSHAWELQPQQPLDRWPVPARSLAALALAAGIGYRFQSGPGPLRFSLALRTAAIPHSGQIRASATTGTIGFAY